jgi:hypothetical protein
MTGTEIFRFKRQTETELTTLEGTLFDLFHYIKYTWGFL